MQTTSQEYQVIFASGDYRVETRLWIGATSATRFYIPESEIFSLQTTHNMFGANYPQVGKCVAGEIDVSLLMPSRTIERMALLRPYYRLVAADGTTSEWLQKGAYYIDTRTVTQNDDGLDVLTLHGYDAMLKAQAEYLGTSGLSYPALDTAIVNVIAAKMGVSVDSRTTDIMTAGYRIPLPVGYSMQEVLCAIAASYAGNFIITDEGKLRLYALTELPVETRYLINESNERITFGGDRILV